MTAPTIIGATPAFLAAQEAIARTREAGTALAHAVAQESALLREKAARKHDAIRRVMQGENRLTGKPHSASSAEALVDTDPEYGAYLAQLSAATVAVLLARSEAETTRLQAQLALLALGVESEAAVTP